MRNTPKRACGAVLAGLTGLAALLLVGADPAMANGGNKRAAPAGVAPLFKPDHQSVIRFREGDVGLHQGIKLGRNKSTLIELPRELRDVVVSNPEIMDAVVQSSNRVYLIGKKPGQSN